MSLLQDACNCTLSGSVLTIDNIVCSVELSELSVNATLVYSSNIGISSSDIFQNLYDTFDMGMSLSLTVSNRILSVKWPLDASPIVVPQEVVLTLLFVAGFIVAAVIISVVFIM